ncbi:hypothetical protein DO71_6011 [Burkholderia pseudomallei]|nr:hypothetical protein DO71_6011 [Burkholderia pseudomallei]
MGLREKDAKKPGPESKTDSSNASIFSAAFPAVLFAGLSSLIRFRTRPRIPFFRIGRPDSSVFPCMSAFSKSSETIVASAELQWTAAEVETSVPACRVTSASMMASKSSRAIRRPLSPYKSRGVPLPRLSAQTTICVSENMSVFKRCLNSFRRAASI